jgi:pimeloyl-ACP methyl ester carboxylesterase
MKIATWVWLVIGIIIIFYAGISAIVALSSPKSPPTMELIAAPFRSMGFSKLPPLSHYTARDGNQLAYRAYPVSHPKKTVVLIHGSSGASISMHALAGYLQGQGIAVYVPDIRGHGDSGSKGDIAYVGQLEDDLEDFVNQVLKGKQEATLVGFSAGGGFALRFAGSSRQKLFANYLLLAPFLRYDAPTTRPNNGEWANASVPRIIGLSLLGPIGKKWFGHLPVLAFAIDPKTAQYQTATYSYRLWSNFGPHYNYKTDMQAAKQPLTVMVGKDDELFYPQKYLSVFASSQPHAEITIVPDVGHITLISDKAGMKAVAEQVSH